MKKALAIRAAPVFALLCGCASQPLPVEELQPDAVKAADQRAALELGCDAMTAHVLRQETIEEGQGTGWYDYPHKAAYTVQVSGCQQRRTYSVTCDERPRKNCVAGAVVVSSPPRQLADDLRPDAVKAADQRGATELACNAVTSQVLRQETIEEAQGTGWYEYPHRAVYSIAVTGCGKQTKYAVACNNRKRSCVAGHTLNTDNE
jgi:hypothetical protein